MSAYNSIANLPMSAETRRRNPGLVELGTAKGGYPLPGAVIHKGLPVPTEDQECIWIAEYLEEKAITKGWVYTKTTQETYTTSWAQKKKNKLMGLKKGLLDYIIVIPGDIVNILVFAEAKRTKGGVLSEDQKKWIAALKGCFKVVVFVAKGFEDFKRQIEAIT